MTEVEQVTIPGQSLWREGLLRLRANRFALICDLS